MPLRIAVKFRPLMLSELSTAPSHPMASSSAIGFRHHNLRKRSSDVAPLSGPTNHKQFDVYMNLPETKVRASVENQMCVSSELIPT